MTLDPAARWVRAYIERHDPTAASPKNRFPFRLRFEHCLRVRTWARRIQRETGGDADVVSMAAIFHDVGKAVDPSRAGHAQRSAALCREYLESADFPARKIDAVCRVVAEHIHHGRQEGAALEDRIVSDADRLDERGAMTVLWDAMAAGGGAEPTYDVVYDRLLGRLGRARDASPLWTDAGERFRRAQIDVLDAYVRQLGFELGRSGA